MNGHLQTYKEVDTNEAAALPTNEPGDPAAPPAVDSVVSRDLCLLGAGILVHILQIGNQLGCAGSAKQSKATGSDR